MLKRTYIHIIALNIFAMCLNYGIATWRIIENHYISGWNIGSFIVGTFSLTVAIWFGITNHKYIKAVK